MTAQEDFHAESATQGNGPAPQRKDQPLLSPALSLEPGQLPAETEVVKKL